MATVAIAGGASASNVALSGNDALFKVETGSVEFSSDGTTYIEIGAGKEIVFYDGTTVRMRNIRPVAASVDYFAY